MQDKIRQTLSQVAQTVKDQVSDLGESAKEKTLKLIEDWLEVFPILEDMGLSITSFGIAISISPALEVEMTGKGEDFTLADLKGHLATHRGSTAITSVLKAIQTTVSMHQKIGKTEPEELYVKIKVRIPPEVRVYFGRPVIL